MIVEDLCEGCGRVLAVRFWGVHRGEETATEKVELATPVFLIHPKVAVAVTVVFAMCAFHFVTIKRRPGLWTHIERALVLTETVTLAMIA